MKILGIASSLLLLALLACPISQAQEANAASNPEPGAKVVQVVPPDLKAMLARMLAARTMLPPKDLSITVPRYSDGLGLDVGWAASPSERLAGFSGYAVLRKGEDGVFVPLPGEPEQLGVRWVYHDVLTRNPLIDGVPREASYRVATLAGNRTALEAWRMAKGEARGDDPVKMAREREAFQRLQGSLGPGLSKTVTGSPKGSWFHWGRFVLFALLASMGALMLYMTARIRLHGPPFIRRIPGIDAIEEAIGRATEMGQPVLYVPGIDELQDLQTIASILILGRVAEIVASYDTDIIVSCCIPVVREVADEVVQTGYYQAGRPDAFKPENIRFISSEQFAFTAGTNGIMYREKPAANLFFGKFFAESLILAETGFVNGCIQVGGTAEPPQLPFFIAACDYTLIGEELFAVSAYLSEDPRLVSSLVASDWFKIGIATCLVVGTVLSSLGFPVLSELLTVGG